MNNMAGTHFIPFVIALLMFGLTGCSGETMAPGEPIAAGADAAEPELSAYLQAMVANAHTNLTSATSRGALAMAYDANGFNAAAEVSYEDAGLLDPRDFRWPYFRARILARLGRNQEALASLDRAIDIDDTYAPAWLWRGTWLTDLDQPREAMAAARKVEKIARDPATAAAAVSIIARAHLRLDQTGDAVRILETQKAIYPHPQILRLLATAQRRLGKADPSAPADADAPPLAWPDAQDQAKMAYIRGLSGRLQLAEQLLQAKKPAEALVILEDLYRTHDTDRDLINDLAVAYKMLDRRDEALALLFKGLTAFPDHHPFNFNIAVLEEDAGNDEIALRHLDRALAANPGLLAAHERKFAILVRLERFDEALDVLNESAQYGKSSAETYFKAGVVAGALERWPLAIERFQQAIALEPLIDKGELYLGRSLAEAGRFDEAHIALAKADAAGATAADVAAAEARLAALQPVAQ
jgi:tetratricopeptide (TPR) repeat protein